MTAGQDVLYKLGRTADPGLTLCAAFAPSGSAGAWQMQIRAQGRGKYQQTLLLETTALCPIASVTLGGESFPLAIGWHARKRGGLLCFGGERKVGAGLLRWEMRWMPVPGHPGRFEAEMRLHATPHRTGLISLRLRVPLHGAEPWSLTAAAMNGHCAQFVRSAYSAWAVGLAALDVECGWDNGARQFELDIARFPCGGGRAIRFTLGFEPAPAESSPRAALVSQYAALADPRLPSPQTIPPLDPAPAAEWLTDSAHYAAPGAERLYLALPGAAAETVWAGAPHYPLDALHALANWNRFHPHPDAPRFVRCGAVGIAADFQVMGKGGSSQPNKGAFWDKRAPEGFADERGDATHGIAANARIARSLFLLHEATGEPLLRQSALNICQWLILKMNEAGWYDGAYVHATSGSERDGHFLPKPCALDGAEAIRSFVLAFRATRSEVFVKAAWKLAVHLLSRMAEFDSATPPVAAAVLQGLIALDAEAPNPRLRTALDSWGAWLRTLPLLPDAPACNADGFHSGFYDCARTGFALFALTHDPAYFRYSLAALQSVPPMSRLSAWRELESHQNALLAVAGFMPQSVVDFDRCTVALDWRTYSPDPATDKYIDVRGEHDQPVRFLPLVCRSSDQLLLLVFAPPGVESVTILKNGRRPLACDLMSGTFDTQANLHLPSGAGCVRVGLFAIDP